MDNFPQAFERKTNGGSRRAGAVAAAILMAFIAVAARFDPIVATAAGAPAMQDDNPPPAPPASANNLEELGQTLKAAVMSGTLSEEAAIKIFYSMAPNLAPKETAKKAAAADKAADNPYRAKRDIMMLSAPQPGRITALLQPEFLQRDLQLLRVTLDLDRQQIAIITMLLRDYLEAFELASTPVRQGLSQYRRSSSDQWMAAALERANIAPADIATANTQRALQRLANNAAKQEAVDGDTSPTRVAESDKKRAAREAWAHRMVEVTATMEHRIAALRMRVQTRLAEMEHEGSMVTIDDLVQMAHEFRDERARLRAEFMESLELVALIEPTESEHARFEAAVARIRIEHDLSHGRLGGESMNLWAALTDATRGDHGDHASELPEVEAILVERQPAIAAMLDDRTQATLDRELRGLQFQATHDRMLAASGWGDLGWSIDATRLASARRPFATACRLELAASTAVRDALLALLDESSALGEAASPDTSLAMRYRDAALRRGFPSEMRCRWSQRAFDAAFKLDDLDGDSHAALVAIDRDVAGTTQTLRMEAIAWRVRRDPERAIQRIETQLENVDARREEFDLDELLGFNHRAYTILHERTEDLLAAILTAEQFASLPLRRTALAAGKTKAADQGRPGGK